MYISARAFQRIFTCKIWLRYSRERALSSLPALRVQIPQVYDPGEVSGRRCELGRAPRPRKRAVETKAGMFLRQQSEIYEWGGRVCMHLQISAGSMLILATQFFIFQFVFRDLKDIPGTIFLHRSKFKSLATFR